MGNREGGRYVVLVLKLLEGREYSRSLCVTLKNDLFGPTVVDFH